MNKDYNKLKQEIDKTNAQIYKNRNTSSNDLEKLIHTLMDNVQKAKEIDYYSGLAEAYRILGLLYGYTGDSVKALESLELSEHICHNFKVDEEVLANLYNVYVYYYIEVVNNYHKAAEYSKKGLYLANKLNLPHLIAKLTINYGVINLDLGLFEESLKSFKSSLEYGEMTDDTLIILYSHVNLGDVYYRLKRYKKAKEHYYIANNINETFEDSMVAVDIKKGLSLTAYDEGDLVQSCEFLEEALIIVSENSLKAYEAEVALLLIDRYLEIGQLEKVFLLLERVEVFIYEVGSNLLIAKYYKNSAKYYAMQNEYKLAYENEQQYIVYQDKVYQERELENISLIRQESGQGKLEQLKFLSEIGKEINTLNSIEEIFDSIYDHMKSYYKSYNIILGLIEDNYIDYVYINNNGKKSSMYKVDKHNKSHLASWVIENNSSVVINDVEKEYSYYIDDYILYGDITLPKSIILIPLKVQDETIGVFGFQTYEKNSFSIDDVEMFSIIASYAAIAVKNSIQSKELMELTIKDHLTGIYNWRYYNSKLHETIVNKGTIDPVSLLIMDIDNFKKVNDKYGHSNGNICLVQLAKLANGHFKEATFVSRIGGEEFAVLLTGIEQEQVIITAENFLSEVRDLKIETEIGMIEFTISIGITICDKDQIESADHMFREADSALYLAKKNGKDRVELYS